MMLFNSPLGDDKASRLIDLLDVPPGGRVLDVGCGRGELLLRIVERTGAVGVGVDVEAPAIAAARRQAAGRVPPDACVFIDQPIAEIDLAGESFDVALCVGSTHAFAAGADAYPAALRGLSRLVRHGGRVLLGEGYWKRPPSPEYVAFIGDPVGIYRDHAENVSLAESFGLVPLYATTSTSDEWDDFEWRHRMRVESLAREHPDDPDVAARLARSRAWRDAYLRWGRAEMGFGFYLFQVP